MRLSIKQKAALLRMAGGPFWKPPRGDGRVQHGFIQTLYSLQRLGLVDYRQGGWSVTRQGERLTPSIREAAKTDHRLRSEATR
jgi:hypothetical protein